MQSDKSNKFSFSKGHRKNSVQTGYSVKLAASLSSDRWDSSILICHQRSSNPIRSSRNFHWFFQLQLYIHEVKAVWKTDLPEKLMEDIPPWTGSPQQSWHYTISGGSKPQPPGKIWPATWFQIQVLWEHSYTRLSMYCLGLLLHYNYRDQMSLKA